MTWGGGGFGGGGTWGDGFGGGGSWGGGFGGGGTWGVDATSLLCIPGWAVPMVAGRLAELEHSRFYADETEWAAGYQFAVRLQEELMTNCLESLIQEIRNARGLRPGAVPVPDPVTGQPVYNSETDYYTLGDVRAAAAETGAILLYATGAMDYESPGGSINDTWGNILDHLPHAGDKAVELVDGSGGSLTAAAIGRLAQGGVIPEGWWLWQRDRRVTLADILKALNAGTGDDGQNPIDIVRDILDTAELGVDVADMVGDAAGEVAQGSILGAILVALLAVSTQIAGSQMQTTAQTIAIKDILRSIQGLTPPEAVSDDHNVLSYLRDTYEATVEVAAMTAEAGALHDQMSVPDIREMLPHTGQFLQWMASYGGPALRNYMGRYAQRADLVAILQALQGVSLPAGVSDNHNILFYLKTLLAPEYIEGQHNLYLQSQAMAEQWAVETPLLQDMRNYLYWLVYDPEGHVGIGALRDRLQLIQEALRGLTEPAGVSDSRNVIAALSRITRALEGADLEEAALSTETYNLVTMLQRLTDYLGLSLTGSAGWTGEPFHTQPETHNLITILDRLLTGLLVEDGSLRQLVALINGVVNDLLTGLLVEDGSLRQLAAMDVGYARRILEAIYEVPEEESLYQFYGASERLSIGTTGGGPWGGAGEEWGGYGEGDMLREAIRFSERNNPFATPDYFHLEGNIGAGTTIRIATGGLPEHVLIYGPDGVLLTQYDSLSRTHTITTPFSAGLAIMRPPRLLAKFSVEVRITPPTGSPPEEPPPGGPTDALVDTYILSDYSTRQQMTGLWTSTGSWQRFFPRTRTGRTLTRAVNRGPLDVWIVTHAGQWKATIPANGTLTNFAWMNDATIDPPEPDGPRHWLYQSGGDPASPQMERRVDVYMSIP